MVVSKIRLLLLLIKVTIVVVMVMVLVVWKLISRMLFSTEGFRAPRAAPNALSESTKLLRLFSVLVSVVEWLTATSLFAQRCDLARLRRAGWPLEGVVHRMFPDESKMRARLLNIDVKAVICTNEGS